jgi:hypothetical protein
MAEAREFNSLTQCLETLISEFNDKYSLFQIQYNDIQLIPYGDDDRINWQDTFMICCVPYEAVTDKEGYVKWFGNKYSIPQQMLGFVALNYNPSDNL